MAVSKAGRTARKKSEKGKARQPDLRKFYGRDLSDVQAGSWSFRVMLLRGRGTKALDLTPLTESFTWENAEASLTGSIDLRRPDPQEPIPIGVGHRVAVDVRWRGSWYRLWQMRAGIPESDLADGSTSVDLTDDLSVLSRNKRNWSYKKTKRRKRGWFGHEIVRDVARKEGLRVGALAKCKYRQGRLVKKDAFALDIIREAYHQEREKSGRRFFIHMRDGKLEVLPLKRNSILYVFKEQVEEALVRQEQALKPVTILKGKARVGKGKQAKKLRYTAMDRKLVARYGKSTQEKDYGRVSSLKVLKDKVNRDYAQKTKVKRTGSLTVPGVPFLRRGDGIRWVSREPGYFGRTEDLRDRSFVYISSISHTVSGSGYTMQMDFVQEDPYVKDAERRDKELREKARKKRKERKK